MPDRDHRSSEHGRDEQGPPAAPGAGSERPFLQRPQGVISVVGGGIAILAAVLALVFDLFPGCRPEPKLELRHFDVDKEENIQADWTLGDVEQPVMNDWKASLVTVLLGNDSGHSVEVTGATFAFSSADELGCPYGAGATEVKARYDVKVPRNLEPPFTRFRKMTFEVPSGARERIGFTVGPKTVPDGARPMAYTFKITLDVDDDYTIETPEVAILDPSHTGVVLDAAEAAAADGERSGFTTVACVQEQARKAQEIVEGTD
ncbi:hypothetical protein ACFCYF_37635 [Streptomyces chartreusis]|uniref:hypothetical protein n=1 Tax=Streptomyces chartreusis TaxID=1969 RepID=UPI0035DE4AAE